MEGSYLLVGGPGTGKSVIALLRARRLAVGKQGHFFLAYNRLLIHYCSALAKPVVITAGTWISWFRALWQAEIGTSVPDNGKQFDLDWNAILSLLQTKETVAKSAFLVIDEGQDMPAAFYQALDHFGFSHLFVVADFNQILFPGQSCNRPELRKALQIEAKNVRELRTNHRNSTSIARLAAHFCALINDPQSPCPDIPEVRDAVIPLLFAYDQDDPKRDLAYVARRIVILADRNPRWLVAVLCPTNATCATYLNALSAANTKLSAKLDCGPARIFHFESHDPSGADFTQGGIVVMTAQSCKGLEFDAVVVADLHWYHDNLSNLQRLYVMVSRAIERVIMLFDVSAHFALDSKMPADPSVLKRVL